MDLLAFLTLFAIAASTARPAFGPGDLPALAPLARIVPWGNPALGLHMLNAALLAGTGLILMRIFKKFYFGKKAHTLVGQVEQERWRNTCAWTAAFLWGLALARFSPAGLALSLPALLLGAAAHRAGMRFPRLRPWFMVLIPLGLLWRAGLSERGNLLAEDFAVNLAKSMPPGSVLLRPGPAARAALLWRRRIWGDRADIVLLDSDDPRDLPEGAPVFYENPEALPPSRRFPEDVLPLGLVCRDFPARTQKLVHPPSQLSLARLAFWWHRRPGPGALGLRPKSLRDRLDNDIVRRGSDAHLWLGEKFSQYELMAEAGAEYNAAVLADPENPAAWSHRGLLALRAGRASAATAALQRAVDLDPGDFWGERNLGFALLDGGRESDALPIFRKAVQLRPENEETRRKLADLLDKNNLPQESLGHWKALRDAHSDDAALTWRLAQTYAALGKTEDALRTLREYLLYPINPEEKDRAEKLMWALKEKT